MQKPKYKIESEAGNNHTLYYWGKYNIWETKGTYGSYTSAVDAMQQMIAENQTNHFFDDSGGPIDPSSNS